MRSSSIITKVPRKVNARCPRCQRDFSCQAGSICSCQCQKVSLTPQDKAYINSRYQGCLCRACLQALRSEYPGRQQAWWIHGLRDG